MKKFLLKAEDALDMAKGSLSDLPNITIYGTSLAEIDNFKGLLDFSPATVRVNTTDGILRIDGINLNLSVMTDDSVSIKGVIKNLCFE